MCRKKTKIIAILLAYNAEKSLKKFYENFPKDLVDDIILIDDASKDNTYELAQELGIKSLKNHKNLGYGGNLKRTLEVALSEGADVIIDIHPDGEYETDSIPLAITRISEGAGLVLGNRFAFQPLKSGMFFWKYFIIKALNCLDNLVLGVSIHDLHTGFRVYEKRMLESCNIKAFSNNFLFSFEIIAQAILLGFKVDEVPVKTRYEGKKRGASLKNSIIYTLGTFKVLFFFILAKIGVKLSIFRNKKDSDVS